MSIVIDMQEMESLKESLKQEKEMSSSLQVNTTLK